MHRDFFNFTPTFKLQLLTNHKPVVKGADFGIWRRLVLLWYTHKYGSQLQIDKREATRLIDPDLEPLLRAEREGIFAWLVRGAKMWYETGLHMPASVIEARENYQNEQDRVKQFVAECCMTGPEYWSAHSGSNGIYPAYAIWCKQAGYHALSLNRFTGELTRVVPSAILEEKRTKIDGRWKTQRGIRGLMVNPDEDGGIAAEANGDLL
jgi:putative DNA primase/helicase